MQRLKIAQRELKSLCCDMLTARCCGPDEIRALAKLRQVLADLTEVEITLARTEPLPGIISEKLEKLRAVQNELETNR